MFPFKNVAFIFIFFVPTFTFSYSVEFKEGEIQSTSNSDKYHVVPSECTPSSADVKNGCSAPYYCANDCLERCTENVDILNIALGTEYICLAYGVGKLGSSDTPIQQTVLNTALGLSGSEGFYLQNREGRLYLFAQASSIVFLIAKDFSRREYPHFSCPEQSYIMPSSQKTSEKVLCEEYGYYSITDRLTCKVAGMLLGYSIYYPEIYQQPYRSIDQ